MKSLSNLFLWAFLMLGAIAAGYHARELFQSPEPAHPAQGAGQIAVGDERVDFLLPDHNGQSHQLSEWDGDVVVMNFWATWCPPCRDEIPAFIDLQLSYGDEGLQFVGVALETPDKVKPYAEEIGLNYPSLVGEAEVIKIAKQYGNDIGGLPYTVLIDRQGIVQYLHQGAIDRATILSQIKKFL